MLFLEPARFLNALDLVGRKVDVLYIPGLAERPPPTPAVYIPLGVWALKQPLCSHLHKITNKPVFYMLLAPYDFAAGQRHYLCNWKGQALKISTFWGQMATPCARCHFRPQKISFLSACPFQLPE